MNLGPVLVDVATKDLSGDALDWAVATALDYKPVFITDEPGPNYWACQVPWPGGYAKVGGEDGYSPSTDWADGGPLIRRCQVDIRHFHFVRGEHRYTEVHACCSLSAKSRPTYISDAELVAVCRAVVHSKLGDIVKVPACLVLP